MVWALAHRNLLRAQTDFGGWVNPPQTVHWGTPPMAPPLIPLLADCVWGGPATAIGGLDGVAGAAAGVAAGLGAAAVGLGAAAVGLDAAAVGLSGAAAVGLSGAVGCWRTLKGEEIPAGAQR